MTKQLIFRAAVIPYYIEDGVVKMLFMKPSNTFYGGDAFQIAKGRIEDDETAEQTAIREGYEELGLRPDNTLSFVNFGVFLGRTTFFLAKVADKNRFDTPHFETAETRWMTCEEFQRKGRDIHRAVVMSAMNLIELLEGMT
ncbi:MAG: NUDIX hydrolase [Candidatus Thermoplasmatota archaeon]